MTNRQNDTRITNSESNRDTESSAKEQTKEAASKIADETRHQAKHAADMVQDQAMSMVSGRKEEAASQLDNIANAFRETGNQLRSQDNAMIARYTDSVADQVERFAGYLHNGDVNEFLSDAESLARRQPELFLGGAFTLGLLAARFFKSSSPSRSGYRGMESDYARRGNWQSSRRSGWDREDRWQDDWQTERRSYRSGYDYDVNRYGSGEVENYPVAGEAGMTGTGAETATVGRTAGMTAGTSAAGTTSSGQTTSRRTFNTNDEDESEKK